MPVSAANDPRLAHRPRRPAALLDVLRQLAGRVAQERLVRRTLRSLNGLDARALRDIGLDASELASVAHEAAGLLERTRWCVRSRLDIRG
nr:DUF1127 domain-containing protein [uncultured Piscinibacter sp.]